MDQNQGDRVRRVTRATAVSAVMVATASLLPGPPASAEPKSRADRVLTQYKELSEKAERTSEEMNRAKSEFDKQRKVVAEQRRASASASRKLSGLEGRMDRAQEKIDALARASYRGARVNRLYAVLVSDSPQSLLDNMSGLEVMSRQSAADLRSVTATARKAREAKSAADDAAREARSSVAKAERHRGRLQAKQSDLQLEAVKIRAMFKSLTGRQLSKLRGPHYDFSIKSVPKGTSTALRAVKAALSKVGSPYSWGADGPSEFDCSGLMVWAYEQADKSLPRTSGAQLAGGTSVDRGDLRPGDLIIYYPGATHVGMYVGHGMVVHASTYGIPVQVVPVDEAGPYNAARRY
ncbi:NlpC/P60 family protein [Gordonia zhaorongruii]|uniref:NlpC/P60 family protein n=1 Tax=Gordonia zhaorongruii TaxID=2597659 RepID=UPI001F43E2F6|nr:NlpC/P60 family protein [Gordonia zhaorongruii]